MPKLIGYFDESGTHQGSTSVAVGGFLSTEKKWSRLKREWQSELDFESIPSMHMSELESRVGIFKGWDQERKLNYQKRIISIIQQHTLRAISASVVHKTYDRLVRADPDTALVKKVGTPYGLCVLICVATSLEWATKKYRGEPVTVQFIFEDGVAQREVEEWIQRQKHIWPQIAGLEFRGKRTELPLQAADFHAYEAWKQTENRQVPDKPVRDVRKSLEALFGMSIDGYLAHEGYLHSRIAEVRNATDY